MKRYLFILFTALSTVLGLNAQVYPVRTITTVSPPYPTSLEQYANVEDGHITVTLIPNDAALQNYPIRLRLVINGGYYKIYTNPSFVHKSMALNNGESLSLTGPELAEWFNPDNLIFEGYTKNQYLKNGRLPEGMYQIWFEVYDFYRDINISGPSKELKATVWTFENDPPTLNYPANGKEVPATDPQNIVLNWTQRQAPFSSAGAANQYKLEVWEIIPDDMNVEEAVRTTRPIYAGEAQSTTFSYSADQPILFPGKKYAWRVQVYDPAGKNRYKNDGYSEVRWFRFGKDCNAPAPVLDKIYFTAAGLKWENDIRFDKYELRWKNKDIANSNWYTKDATGQGITIDKLEQNTSYYVQIRGFCGVQEGDYSQSITIKTKQDIRFACGGEPGVLDSADNVPLAALAPGEVFRAYDFDIETYKVSGGNGTFTGKGFALVPLLKSIKFEVEFSSVTINSKRRMTKGEVKFIYNEKNGLVANVGKLIKAITSGENDIENNPYEEAADKKIYMNAPVASVNVSATGEVTVVAENGDKKTIRTTTGDMVYVGGGSDDAQQTVVDTENKTVYKATPEKTDGSTIALPVSKSEPIAYKVTFLPHALTTLGGIDYPSSTSPAGNYNHATIGGAQVPVPWKSVESNKIERLVAAIQGPADSIHFITKNLNMVMTAPGDKSAVGRNNQEYQASSFQQLLVTGVDDEDELKAWYAEYEQVNDTTIKQNRILASQVNIAAYDKIELDVCIVEVNGAAVPNTEPIEESLNKIYASALVKWKVTRLNNFNVALTALKNGKFDSDHPSAMKYNDCETEVIDAFKQRSDYNRKTIYLFFIGGEKYPTTNRGNKGYMQFNRNFGFIFRDNQDPNELIRTMAHELGHGAFRLRHTFSADCPHPQTEGQTQNLMDYVDKSKATSAILLHKYQWKEVHDWDLGLNWFEGGEEGEAVTLEIEKNRGIEINYDKEEDRTYLTPSGKPITLPPAIKVLEFITSCPKLNIPQGALVAFKVGEDKIFCANYPKGKFIGYVNKDNPKDVYPDKKTEYKIGDKVFIGLPSTANCQLEISIGELTINFNETDNERKGIISPSLPVTNLKLYNFFKDPSVCFTGIAKEYYETGKGASGEYKDALLRIATLIQKTGDGLFKDYETAFANNPAYLDRLEQQSLWGNQLQDYLAFEDALRAFNDNKADLEQQILATDDPSRVIKLSFMLTYDYHKSIKYKTRLHILQVISNKTIIGGWAERIVNRVLSDVPVEDVSTLVSDLKQNNLLKKLYYGIDGDNFDEFIANIQKVTNDFYGGEEKVKEYGRTLIDDRLIIFGRDGFSDYGATHEFNSDGTLKLSTWRNDISYSYENGSSILHITRKDNIPISSDPFTLVGFTLLKNGEKPQVYIMPLVCASGKITRQKTGEVKTAIKTIVTVGSFFIGAGEVMAATTAFKIVVASFDLGMNAADVILNMEQVQNKIKGLDGGATFLSVWEKVNFAYSIATLPSTVMSSAEAASSFAKAWKELRAKNAIKAEEELTADVCKKLDGFAEDIEKGITKITDDFLDIGKPIDNLTIPPKGYSFYKRADGKKWIRRIDASDPNTPRLTVRNGEIARFSGAIDINQTVEFVYHVKSDKFVQNVIDDIEPAFFGADNRFGQGFYVATEGETALAEVMHHGGNPAASKVIRFTIDESQLKILDLTDESTAKIWKYNEAREFELAHMEEGKDIYYRLFQEIAKKSKEAGYNAIKYNSFRNSGGVNYVILETINKEFYKQVLKPQMVMPGEE